MLESSEVQSFQVDYAWTGKQIEACVLNYTLSMRSYITHTHTAAVERNYVCLYPVSLVRLSGSSQGESQEKNMRVLSVNTYTNRNPPGAYYIGPWGLWVPDIVGTRAVILN